MKKAYKIPSIYLRMVKIKSSMIATSGPSKGYKITEVKEEKNVVFESKTINFAEGWTTSDNEW